MAVADRDPEPYLGLPNHWEASMRRNMSVSVGSLLLAATVVSCAQRPADSAPLSDADVTAIRGVFSRVVETLRAQDWDAFIATFDDQVVFHPANNAPLHGKDELRAWIPRPRAAARTRRSS